MSNSLRPHELQHARLLCPSESLVWLPDVWSNSRPLRQWCHPTISSSVAPFSYYPQSFPASGSFPMSRIFTSGGRSTGASASTSVLPMNIQGWFPLGLVDLFGVQGTLKSLLQNHSWKVSISLALSLLYGPTLTSLHDYWKNSNYHYIYLYQQSDLTLYIHSFSDSFPI